MIKIGIDIGSTTAKVVALDNESKILFSRYERHNTKTKEVLVNILKELQDQTGDIEADIKITGSVGYGFSEQLGITFIQEVVASTKAVQKYHPNTSTMIDIGGEDAKIVFFKNAEAIDLRMNGNCAGGTGSFIDQMALILGVNINELNELALNATHVHPIASRCGVFCKTDIQNLIAKNVCKEEIAASIFHAVAVQTIVTLAHGYNISTPILFCGGPLTYLPALRKAFIDYLNLKDQDIIIPQNGSLLPALGTAISDTEDAKTYRLSEFINMLSMDQKRTNMTNPNLTAIFESKQDYENWKTRISKDNIAKAKLNPGEQEVFIGIDSGSTTTKIVVTNTENQILYTFYKKNQGNPIETVEEGLCELNNICKEYGAILNIKGGCSTGYGEDLIKTAFQLDCGIVETIAHYEGAKHLNKDVSFILDIGGQDMKAIFVNKGIINQIEINEACSSGCGSFIETFANTLGYSAQDFSIAACKSTMPCDLGTRCTVFMNSKVKQVLREGACVNDIAAGLAYSVIKNCLYKVLKVKDTSVFGDNIVVQGGTMRNDAIVRVMELMTGTKVTRCDIPELMGAFGCALYAHKHSHISRSLHEIMNKAHYSSNLLHCKGCENKCLISRYHFDNGKDYYSGNRCEKYFCNGEHKIQGLNAYLQKEKLLFERQNKNLSNPIMTIGIPRVLNMYENFPFWHTLFTNCGIQVQVSDKSNFKRYEECARMVMSDNICFPAKLVHSHIQNLIDREVDRIFMPYVIFEKQGKEQNSYNCPIVTGYSDVIKSVQSTKTPIDSPAISFKDKTLLYKQCHQYLEGLGIKKDVIEKALIIAEKEQEQYEVQITECNKEILKDARMKKRLTILLAGRPYHTDPLIQHKISNLIAGMGVNVITEDIARNEKLNIENVHYLDQWAYPNHILKSAQWCSMQDSHVQFIEMTSFGCGPDAFLIDEIRDLLKRNNKVLTILKLDDINNVGSMKIRIRSLIESLNISKVEKNITNSSINFNNNNYNLYERKILIPYFTPFISPLIPSILKIAGYDAENLPLSDIQSCEWGLKFANNEICYPATLIVGDVIKAFKSGKYNSDKCVIAMTQTGGQCRASNYVAIIQKALIEAGYKNTPVISLTFGDEIKENQLKLKINWVKILPIAIKTILYSDCISKFYYASVIREKEPGQALKLKDLFLQTAEHLILNNRTKEMFHYLSLASKQFNSICCNSDTPKVGVVGEIFLKFNPFAQKNIIEWLIDKKIEVAPSVLTDFFMQSFVNGKIRSESYIIKNSLPKFIYKFIYRNINKQIEEVNRIGSQFRYFTPFKNIFEEAEDAQKVISLNAQFGEGWLLPAEIISYSQQGISNVISLQPFGCIANHIVSKGIEKRIKQLYPHLNILSLDFDSGVSDVNIINRMLLFIENLKK